MVQRVRDRNIGRRAEPAGRRAGEVLWELALEFEHRALPQRRGRVLEVPGCHLAESLPEQGTVHAGRVLVTAPGWIVLAEADAGRGLDELRDSARGEKQLWTDRPAEEHVIV